MRFRITAGARKHGITAEQVRYVVRHCGLVLELPPPDDPTEPDRLVYLGDDVHGVALEVMGILGEDGATLVVIHAMRLRRKYRNEYEEALLWRIVP